MYFEKDIEVTREEIVERISEKKEHLSEIKSEGKTTTYIKELSDLALLQLEIENYKEAKKNLEICLEHFRKQKDRLGIASVLGILGTLYFKKNDYKKAIKYYEQSYEIYDELKQIKEKIMSLKGIGNSYINLGRLEKANDIFLKCSSISSKEDDIYNLLDCLSNLVYIHENQGNWDVLFELYQKILKIYKKLKDQKGIITANFNLGIIMKKNQNLEESLYYFKSGTNVAIDSNYSELIIKGLSYVGEIQYYLGNIENAKNQFIKALYLAQEVKAKNAILQLKTLLTSLGLKNKEITEELKSYKEKNNEINL
ncbi:MAG: Tetratricopeptide repeat protein [Promethearchaeota archaeon]|nr:MAG: Tetratricopeptide repeat protein [Candidatus Lokiarchaeota archaeon]